MKKIISNLSLESRLLHILAQNQGDTSPEAIAELLDLIKQLLLKNQALLSITKLEHIDLATHFEITGKLASTLIKSIIKESFREIDITTEEKAFIMAHPEKVIAGIANHDTGKLGVGKHILFKPGPLTKMEFNVIKHHPDMGASIIKSTFNSMANHPNISLLLGYLLISNQEHQEKYDGSGYPNGLKQSEISFTGRLSKLIDVYHALRGERSYKKEWPPEKVWKHLKDNCGSEFDPTLVAFFFKHNLHLEFEKVLDPQ